MLNARLLYGTFAVAGAKERLPATRIDIPRNPVNPTYIWNRQTTVRLLTTVGRK